MTDQNATPKVVMLAHTFYLRDPRVRREAEALAEFGLDVHVICLTEYHDSKTGDSGLPTLVNNVHIHRLPVTKRRGSSVRYLYEYSLVGLLGGLVLLWMQFKGRIAVVHVHNMPDILVLSAAIPRLFGSKVVLDVHDPMPELYSSWNKSQADGLLVKILRVQEKISHKCADCFFTVNRSMRDNLCQKGVSESRLFVVHNFPDENIFPLQEEPVVWPRGKSGLVLLYCGTVTEHYDLPVAVRAIATLAGRVPVTLRIIGDGNRLDEVLTLASELGVTGSIEHIGVIPIERVRDEMRKADVGISCHRAGSFGDLYFSTKIVEYLTQGLPVLSSRTRTINEYLPDDCLFYFEPGDAKSFADRLLFMWQHPEAVLASVASARRRLPQLSWGKEKSTFLSLYSALLEGRLDPNKCRTFV